MIGIETLYTWNPTMNNFEIIQWLNNKEKEKGSVFFFKMYVEYVINHMIVFENRHLGRNQALK